MPACSHSLLGVHCYADCVHTHQPVPQPAALAAHLGLCQYISPPAWPFCPLDSSYLDMALPHQFFLDGCKPLFHLGYCAPWIRVLAGATYPTTPFHAHTRITHYAMPWRTLQTLPPLVMPGDYAPAVAPLVCTGTGALTRTATTPFSPDVPLRHLRTWYAAITWG